jgi:hypothetical protein
VPLRYLPSGRKYASGAHEQIRGIVEDFHQRWLIAQAYQRHLLQLGFTDRLLGSVLRRLRRTRRYNRSLIVVTADNGESFGRVGDRHVINPHNAGDIALTPLFIKRPGQRRGRIVRRHVRMVDVVPSIAHVLRLPLPWRTNGRSVFGAPARRIPSGVTLSRRSGARLHLSFASLRRRGRQALRRKLRLFGSGPWEPSLYRIGPFRVLNGKPARLFPIRRSRHLRAIVHPSAKLQRVGSRPGFLPSYITGKIVGGRPRRSRNLALTVNGVIAATFPSFHLRGARTELYSNLVPESALRQGRNRVKVYAISRRRGKLGLVALR